MSEAARTTAKGARAATSLLMGKAVLLGHQAGSGLQPAHDVHALLGCEHSSPRFVRRRASKWPLGHGSSF